MTDNWTLAVPRDYRTAAQAWLTDPRNPDGWLADPEAMLALNEAMQDAQRGGGDPLEAARHWWRTTHKRWLATQDPHYAGELVAVEDEVTAWKRADHCTPGQHCDGANLRLCSKHSWEYQSKYGRAYNE